MFSFRRLTETGHPALQMTASSEFRPCQNRVEDTLVEVQDPKFNHRFPTTLLRAMVVRARADLESIHNAHANFPVRIESIV